MPRDDYTFPMIVSPLPYPIPPEGLIWSTLPQAFLTGMDIARALQTEKEARRIRELQVEQALAEQDLRLVTLLYELLGRQYEPGDLTKFLPKAEYEKIRERIAKRTGLDIAQFKVPSIKEIYPNISDIFVDPGISETKGTTALGVFYEVVPGDLIVDALGEIELGGEKLSRTKQYLVPKGATRTFLEARKYELKAEEIKQKSAQKLKDWQQKGEKDKIDKMIKYIKLLQENYKPELIAKPDTIRKINEALRELGKELGFEFEELTEFDLMAQTTKKTLFDDIVSFFSQLLGTQQTQQQRIQQQTQTLPPSPQPPAGMKVIEKKK